MTPLTCPPPHYPWKVVNIIMLETSSPSIFPPLYLILGTWPRLGNKRGCKLGECLRPQAHPISVGECKEMSPKHSQVTSIMKVVVARVFRILGTKVQTIIWSKLGLQHSMKRDLKCKGWKWAHNFHFKLWDRSYGQKKGSAIKLTIWFLSIKTRKQGSNDLQIGHVIQHWKVVFKGYKFFF